MGGRNYIEEGSSRLEGGIDEISTQEGPTVNDISGITTPDSRIGGIAVRGTAKYTSRVSITTRIEVW